MAYALYRRRNAMLSYSSVPGAAGSLRFPKTELFGMAVVVCASCLSAQGQSCVQYPTRNIINPMLYAPGFPRGERLAASGSILFAGRAVDSALGPNVWVMEETDDQWVVTSKLYPWDGGTSFSASIAVDDDVLMIGGSERVYVFQRNGSEWLPKQILTAPDGVLGDLFGLAVAVAGNAAVIGAPYDDEPLFANRGSAYVYQYDGKQWNFEQKITPGAVPTNTNFGRDVSIEGDVIAVSESNRCRVFEHINQIIWIQTATFNGFGADVQLHQQQVFAGGSGIVSIIEKVDGDWTQVDSITGSDVVTGDSFGDDIAIEGDTMVVTAPMKEDGVQPDDMILGAGYVFTKTEQGWVETHKLLPSLNGEWQENIASSIAITDESIVCGSTNMAMALATGYIGSIFEFSLDDCNANEIPDACEAPDCDESGTPDECEIAAGTAGDCNANGIPDHCEQLMSYQLDDGSAEIAWGFENFGPPGREVVYMNQFTVLPGHEFIDVVSFPWSVWYFPGVPVSIALYDDPNNDGLPQDATLLTARDILSGYDDQLPQLNEGSSRYTIPRIFVGAPGESFFVAVNVWMARKSHPFIADAEGPAQSRSWVVMAPFPTDISDLSVFTSFQLLPTGDNLLIRAGTLDCNGNGAWDACDINQGSSLDANGNGTPDECEIFACISDVMPPGGDGQIDVDDLLFVIEAWGKCDTSPCEADIAPLPNGNGFVDVDDLLAVINAWGACQ
jgi:hypothetical protein